VSSGLRGVTSNTPLLASGNAPEALAWWDTIHIGLSSLHWNRAHQSMSVEHSTATDVAQEQRSQQWCA
jgi:hypothetical protein